MYALHAHFQCHSQQLPSETIHMIKHMQWCLQEGLESFATLRAFCSRPREVALRAKGFSERFETLPDF